MDTETAENFARQWIKAWNDHDLEAILSHYAEDIRFYSPLIPALGFNEAGMIDNKTDLRAYFSLGLQKFPELRFELHYCFAGLGSLVLYYTSVNGRQAAEVFELDDHDRATLVRCNYAAPRT